MKGALVICRQHHHAISCALTQHAALVVAIFAFLVALGAIGALVGGMRR